MTWRIVAENDCSINSTQMLMSSASFYVVRSKQQPQVLVTELCTSQAL